MRRFCNIAGSLLLIASLLVTGYQNRFVVSSQMTLGAVYGFPSWLAPDAQQIQLIERSLLLPDDEVTAASQLAGCKKDGPCYPLVLFRAGDRPVTIRQFSCGGPLKFLEWGFPFVGRCMAREDGPAYWGRIGIVYDPENPGRFYYDSLLSILEVPILLLGAGLALLMLGAFLRMMESVPARS